MKPYDPKTDWQQGWFIFNCLCKLMISLTDKKYNI